MKNKLVSKHEAQSLDSRATHRETNVDAHYTHQTTLRDVCRAVCDQKRIEFPFDILFSKQKRTCNCSNNAMSRFNACNTRVDKPSSTLTRDDGNDTK